jgi:SAM-dependent methyltransferase
MERCSSITASGFDSDSFDCVAIVGGLHHLHPHVGEAVGEIQRILKPGGSFCFAEPYRGSLPDLVRSFWYKHDNLFASNEASIDLQALKKKFATVFSFDREKYLGNVAYLLGLEFNGFQNTGQTQTALLPDRNDRRIVYSKVSWKITFLFRRVPMAKDMICVWCILTTKA